MISVLDWCKILVEIIIQDEFLCPAHPLWDEKNPSMYKKKLEKYIPQQQRRDRDIKQQKVNIWKTKGIKEDGTRYKILSPHVGLKKNEELQHCL